jgi:hypothetical protein
MATMEDGGPCLKDVRLRDVALATEQGDTFWVGPKAHWIIVWPGYVFLSCYE